ncbi:MAG TPA: NADH-quinone oxidoreductase subunit J [Symbiobacteriaceae bacterium]|jgi:NADH-quinone oxidoreductase subunit J
MNPVFVVAGIIAIAGALGVLLAKHPVHQVVATLANFIGLAALYLSLSSEFMAVIQLIIYGGAVLILFLFVIALLTARRDPVERDEDQLPGQKVAGYAVGGAVLLMLALVGAMRSISPGEVAAIEPDFGSVARFGYELLTTHLLPFELLAFILMVAVVGVVILVGRQKA